MAAEESKGIIGGQASRGGGWDLITTIITIICLGLIALSDPCTNWIAQGPCWERAEGVPAVFFCKEEVRAG